jgi:hypothetical protein
MQLLPIDALAAGPCRSLDEVAAVGGGRGDVQRDVLPVAGQADEHPVALPSAFAAVVELPVAGHAELHGRFELRQRPADQVAHGADLAAARIAEPLGR